MQSHGFEEILAQHPVFSPFGTEILALLAGCARHEHFAAGTTIYAENDPADRLYLLRHGSVAVEISSSERAPLIAETLHPGQVLGWSWMVPPYRHASDARAQSDVRAVSLDAACMRRKCDDTPAIGYELFKHLLPHMAARVRALRMQLLDLYGTERC